RLGRSNIRLVHRTLPLLPSWRSPDYCGYLCGYAWTFAGKNLGKINLLRCGWDAVSAHTHPRTGDRKNGCAGNSCADRRIGPSALAGARRELSASASDGKHVAFTLRHLVEHIGPSLHHLSALWQAGRVVICRLRLVPFGMRELSFDQLG